MTTAVATKRVCICGCGVPLSRYNEDDYTYACWNRLAEMGELPEPDPQTTTRRGPQPGVRLFSDEELLDLLREKAKQLGRPPLRDEMTRIGATGRTYQRRFGSWPKAIRAAGFDHRISIMGSTKTRLLDVLADGPKNAKEISEKTGRAYSAVTGTISDLYRSGHLVREVRTLDGKTRVFYGLAEYR